MPAGGRAFRQVLAPHKEQCAEEDLLYIGATWTFTDWMIQPYAGLGFGIAFALLNPEVETTITETYYGIKGDPDKYDEQHFYPLFNFVLGAVYHF